MSHPHYRKQVETAGTSCIPWGFSAWTDYEIGPFFWIVSFPKGTCKLISTKAHLTRCIHSFLSLSVFFYQLFEFVGWFIAARTMKYPRDFSICLLCKTRPKFRLLWNELNKPFPRLSVKSSSNLVLLFIQLSSLHDVLKLISWICHWSELNVLIEKILLHSFVFLKTWNPEWHWGSFRFLPAHKPTNGMASQKMRHINSSHCLH